MLEEKATHEENVIACFTPEIDFQEALVALITKDESKLAKMKAYIEMNETMKQQTLAAIAGKTDEEEIIKILGKVQGVSKDG